MMTRWRWMLFLAGIIVTLLVLKGLKACAFSIIELRGAEFTTDSGSEADPSKPRAEADDLSPLPQWQAEEGMPPTPIFIRCHVHSYGNQKSPLTPIKIIVWVKTGDFLVDSQTLLVDTDNLQRTAQWEPLTTFSFSVPSLSPNTIQTVASPALPFQTYLNSLHHRYPTMLKATVQILNSTHTTYTLTLPILPNHFAIEDLEK